MSGELTRRVAAIDCGTNSTRLLVADAERSGGEGGRGPVLRPIVRLMRITRLGQGVDATGRFHADAIDRTTAVLREFRQVLVETGVKVDGDSVRVAATSAARDASNREELFGSVRSIVGVDAELLTGEEEGCLSFLGATAGLPAERGPFTVVDVGGGSTEVVAGRLDDHGQPVVEGLHSADVGCVRVTEKHLASDPPTGEQLRAAIADIDAVLATALERVPAARRFGTLIGLAGTVSALASIDLGLAHYDAEKIHHHRLGAAAVDRIIEDLAALPVGRRREVVGLEPERADVIVGGCLVVQRVLAALGADVLLVSEADIIDGLALNLAYPGRVHLSVVEPDKCTRPGDGQSLPSR